MVGVERVPQVDHHALSENEVVVDWVVRLILLSYLCLFIEIHFPVTSDLPFRVLSLVAVKQRQWLVPGLSPPTTDSVSRVEADVVGYSLWFSSSDVVTRPSAASIARARQGY